MAKRERVSIDAAGLIAQIDAYPEAAGVDAALWRQMTYPQKCRYLIEKQLAAVQERTGD